MLKYLLRQRTHKLMERDQATWWDIMGKMQVMLRKGALELFMDRKMDREQMHNYVMSGRLFLLLFLFFFRTSCSFSASFSPSSFVPPPQYPLSSSPLLPSHAAPSHLNLPPSPTSSFSYSFLFSSSCSLSSSFINSRPFSLSYHLNTPQSPTPITFPFALLRFVVAEKSRDCDC